MRLAGALAGVLAAACVVAPHASASSLRRIGSSNELAVHSDAARWYAYQEHPGVVVAVDTRTHTRVATQEPARCSLQDLRFARLLLDCRPDPVARLVSLPSGATTDFPPPPANNDPPPIEEFVALGRYWLAGFTCEEGSRCAQIYLNRRSRERRTVSPDENGNPNALVADIDSPDLELKDTTNLVDLLNGGYRLRQGSNPDDALVLSHGRHRLTLSECRNTCRFATLGGGLVTWSDGRVRAYSLRRQKAYSWRVPPTGFVAALVHTATTVLVRTRVQGTASTSGHEALYAAGVPRR
jgi:hypothetical protein